MTDFRAKGFKGKDLASQLLEVDEPVADDATEDDPEDIDLVAAQHEVAWLRKEVHDLEETLVVVRGKANDVATRNRNSYPWGRIAGALVCTVLLGGMLRMSRS
jgi:hypothetical protein